MGEQHLVVAEPRRPPTPSEKTPPLPAPSASKLMQASSQSGIPLAGARAVDVVAAPAPAPLGSASRIRGIRRADGGCAAPCRPPTQTDGSREEMGIQRHVGACHTLNTGAWGGGGRPGCGAAPRPSSRRSAPAPWLPPTPPWLDLLVEAATRILHPLLRPPGTRQPIPPHVSAPPSARAANPGTRSIGRGDRERREEEEAQWGGPSGDRVGGTSEEWGGGGGASRSRGRE